MSAAGPASVAAVAGSVELAWESAAVSVVAAAKVAGFSAALLTASLPAGVRLRLVAPDGGSLGGRILRVSSRSRCEISCSIWDLNSLEARLNSLRYFPTCRAISGNFFGPKTMRASTKRKIVSPKLIRSSYCRSRRTSNHPEDKPLTTFFPAYPYDISSCNSGSPGAVKSASPIDDCVLKGRGFEPRRKWRKINGGFSR